MSANQVANNIRDIFIRKQSAAWSLCQVHLRALSHTRFRLLGVTSTFVFISLPSVTSTFVSDFFLSISRISPSIYIICSCRRCFRENCRANYVLRVCLPFGFGLGISVARTAEAVPIAWASTMPMILVSLAGDAKRMPESPNRLPTSSS